MRKSILVSLIAVFAVLALLSVVSAEDTLATSWQEVTVDGGSVSPGSTISGITAGSVVPIKVVFKAEEDASDVRVKAWIDGYRSDITAKTERFEFVDGSQYTKYLSLELPSDIDPTEVYFLKISISNRAASSDKVYTLRLQRSSYKVEVLSAEFPDKATAGSVVEVDVVLKNWGMHKLDDIFVVARIPELGVQKKVYFGDLNELDEEDYIDYVFDQDDYDEEDLLIALKEANRNDAVERRIYLEIPDNAKAGIYNLEVEAYNVDSANVVKRSIVISGTEGISDILSGTSSRTLNIGEEVTYDLVIVNSGSKMKVFTLTPGEAKGLLVEVDSIVTVPADSSKTVEVKVKATESAEEGTNVVTINVKSDDLLVKAVDFTANVEKGSVTGSNSVVILTIILVIVFVVLLIILIVLLTRKPAATETEETSYY